MKVDVDGKSYTFDVDRVLNVELMAIERAIGMTSLEWQDALNNGSMTAATALVWLLRKRHEDPTTKFDDVVFETGTLLIAPEPEDDETDDVMVPKDESTPATEVSSEPTTTGEPSSSSPDSDSDRGKPTV
jgi:hypothetical protein